MQGGGGAGSRVRAGAGAVWGRGASGLAPRPGRIPAVAAAAPAWPERPGLPHRAPGLPLTRLSPCPFLPRPVPLSAPRRRRAGAAVFPSRRLGLSLSPGPAGDVSHTCAEDAPVTGEEAAAGGGAGGGEGAPTSSCSPAPWPGTVPAPSHPPPARPPSLSSPQPPPPHGRPPSPGAAGLFGPLGPLSSRPPTSPRSQAGFGNALTAAG